MTFAPPIIPWPPLLALAFVAVLGFTAWTYMRRVRSQPLRTWRPAALRSVAVVLLLLAALRPGWQVAKPKPPPLTSTSTSS